jgi:hypothetical protein
MRHAYIHIHTHPADDDQHGGNRRKKKSKSLTHTYIYDEVRHDASVSYAYVSFLRIGTFFKNVEKESDESICQRSESLRGDTYGYVFFPRASISLSLLGQLSLYAIRSIKYQIHNWIFFKSTTRYSYYYHSIFIYVRKRHVYRNIFTT